MKRLLPILCAGLIVLGGSGRAETCTSLLLDEVPCELSFGDPAPYSGTLMSRSTARSLADKVFELEDLRIDLEALRLASRVERERDAIKIVELKIALENAPRPLLEQPAFWIVSGLALIGGFVAGAVLVN